MKHFTVVTALTFTAGLVAATPTMAVPPAHSRAASLPKAFWGEWHPEAQACTGNIPDDGALISATAIEVGEDTNTVVKIQVLSAQRIRVYTDNEGEQTPGDPGDAHSGRSWQTLALSDNGQMLQQTVKLAGKPYTYRFVRCHEQTAAEKAQAESGQ